MSSEAEARDAVLRDVTSIQRHAFDSGNARMLVPDMPLRLDRTAQLLDAYRTAIERRVLAQQPCYRTMVVLQHNEKWNKPCDCNPCTARQTQETSG